MSTSALGPVRYSEQHDRRGHTSRGPSSSSSGTYRDPSAVSANRRAVDKYPRRAMPIPPLDVPSRRNASPRPASSRSSSPRPRRKSTILAYSCELLADLNPYIAVMKWARGQRIGEGSYGKVFLAMNVTTGEVMAVKQVEKPTTAADRLNSRADAVIKALRDESETLRQLDHPYIVQYLGWEENPETLNIFLEYIPGGTVKSCLRRYGVFKDDVSRSFAAQIIDGLQYLHSRGVIHRDLKAENILVQPMGICKISDFGISKHNTGDNVRAFTAMRGTLHWMAPEMIEGRGQVGYTNKVDIWSLGCVVLEMWSAERPWGEDSNMLEVLVKVVQEKSLPPVPEGVVLTAAMEDFRQACFCVDPQYRSSAAELLQHEYLDLPDNWEFPGMDEMGKLPQSMIRNRERSEDDSTPQPLAAGPAARGDMTLVGRTVTVMPQRSHRSQSVSPDPARTAIPSSSNSSPRGNDGGPKLVYITPPGSPVASRFSEDWMLGRSTSSETQPGKPKTNRKLVVHNPDEPTHTPRETPVYEPPPLPDAPPTSNRLDAPAKRYEPALLEQPGNQRLSPNRPPLLADEPCCPRRGGNGYPSGTGVTDFTDESSGSTWKVPPAELAPRNRGTSFMAKAMDLMRRSSTASTSSTSSSTIPLSLSSSSMPPTSVIPAPARASTSTPPPPITTALSRSSPPRWPPPMPRKMTRPVVEEVYQNLTGFFPDHDLDDPIVESPIDPPRGHHGRAPFDHGNFNTERRVTMKSIRDMAGEQRELEIQRARGAPRRTALWDAQVEEINSSAWSGQQVLRANRRPS